MRILRRLRIDCRSAIIAGLLVTLAAPGLAAPGLAAPAAPSVSERAASCIRSAAMYHRVNENILTAIVLHESRGRPSTINRNSNGSIDVGLTGINSVHFLELQRKGVAPENLMDECVSVYVGAWTYAKKVFKYGNTWQAVGAYHSETPYYGQRYQVLIYNTMVAMGVLSGPALTVPPLLSRR